MTAPYDRPEAEQRIFRAIDEFLTGQSARNPHGYWISSRSVQLLHQRKALAALEPTDRKFASYTVNWFHLPRRRLIPLSTRRSNTSIRKPTMPMAIMPDMTMAVLMLLWPLTMR